MLWKHIIFCFERSTPDPWQKGCYLLHLYSLYVYILIEFMKHNLMAFIKRGNIFIQPFIVYCDVKINLSECICHTFWPKKMQYMQNRREAVQQRRKCICMFSFLWTFSHKNKMYASDMFLHVLLNRSDLVRIFSWPMLSSVADSSGCWPAGYCVKSHPSGAPDSRCHHHY